MVLKTVPFLRLIQFIVFLEKEATNYKTNKISLMCRIPFIKLVFNNVTNIFNLETNLSRK